MTNLGLLQHSLGLEYFFHLDGITVIQCGYAHQMLIDFGYAKCNAAIVPMHLGLKFKLDMEALIVDIFLYQ
jgi:hypothetical protein